MIDSMYRPAAGLIAWGLSLGLLGCSKSGDAPASAPAANPGAVAQIEAAASAIVTPVLTPAVVAAVDAATPAAHAPGVAWRYPATEAEMQALQEESRRSNKPLFLYWGAVWCPPCNQVKATVFKHAEFIERSRSFVPVYLDGDTPGAQKLGERFKVRGYPSMVLLRPDGRELTRLPGEVDTRKYLQVLSLGLASARPAREVLALALATPARMSAADWRLLAYYSWDTDEQALLPKADLPRTLSKLALACPSSETEARARLGLRALVAQADAVNGKPGKAPVVAAARAQASARAQVTALLSDEALLRDNLDLATHHARLLTAALTPGGTPEREALSAHWAATLDRLSADAGLSQGDRASALIARVQLARLDAGVADKAPVKLNEVLLAHVRREAARLDRDVGDANERQSVIPSAAYALAQAGLLDDADRLLERELTRSHSPYYAMLSLASNAKQRGDKLAALDWHERAYAASQGMATRVQWGSGYVNALVELAPEDTARIERATGAVLGELVGQRDAFYERTARSLDRMSGKLLAWPRGPAEAAALERLRAQRDGLCRALPSGDAQRSTCEALLRPAASPPRNAKTKAITA